MASGVGSGGGGADPSLVFLCVFSRDAGSSDESASDEEQLEKLLFLHDKEQQAVMEGFASASSPSSAAAAAAAAAAGGRGGSSLENAQLSRLTLCEALIDFTSRFSETPLETVVCQGMQIAMLEAGGKGSGLWLAMGIKNAMVRDVALDRRPVTSAVNNMGARAVLHEILDLHALLFGDALATLQSEWDTVERAKDLRKRIRKLINRREQTTALLHANKGLLSEEEKAERAQKRREEGELRMTLEAELQTSLEQSPIRHLRRSLAQCVAWYLSVHRMREITMLSEIAGFHFLPLTHGIFQELVHTLYSVHERFKARGVVSMCVVYSGQIVWCELERAIMLKLYKLLKLRNASLSPDTVEVNPSLGPPSAAAGFLDAAWKVVDLLNTDGGADPIAATAATGSGARGQQDAQEHQRRQQKRRSLFGGGGGSNTTNATGAGGSAAVPAAEPLFLNASYGPRHIWCPRIYLKPHMPRVPDHADAAEFEIDPDKRELGSTLAALERLAFMRMAILREHNFHVLFFLRESSLRPEERGDTGATVSASAEDQDQRTGPMAEPAVDGDAFTRLCRDLQAALMEKLRAFDHRIRVSGVERSAFPPDVKAIYFNRSNLAFKAANVLRPAQALPFGAGASYRQVIVRFPPLPAVLGSQLPPCLLRAIADAHEHFRNRADQDGMSEFCVHVPHVAWVFANRTSDREVYMLLPPRSPFQEAHETVTRVSNKAFGKMLLMG